MIVVHRVWEIFHVMLFYGSSASSQLEISGEFISDGVVDVIELDPSTAPNLMID